MPRAAAEVRSDQAFGKPFQWTVKGSILTFSPLRLDDLGEITAHLRGIMLRPALQACADPRMSADNRRLLMEVAYNALSGIDMIAGGEQTERLFMDPSSLVFVMYRSASRTDPKATMAAVGGWYGIDDIEDCNNLVAEIMKVSGFTSTAPPPPAAGTDTTTTTPAGEVKPAPVTFQPGAVHPAPGSGDGVGP